MKKVTVNYLINTEASSYMGKNILEYTYKTGEVVKGKEAYLGLINLQACICFDGSLLTIELNKIDNIVFEE